MKNHLFSASRRKFLQTSLTAAIAAPLLLGCARKTRKPNSRLNHACIGVGGMGWWDFLQFKEDPNVQIIALCDVDAENLKKASEAFPGARTYVDWRELLEKEGNCLTL